MTLSHLLQISILSFVRTNLAASGVRIVPYRAVRTRFARGAVFGIGRLVLGSTWPGVPRNKGFFSILSGGRCSVNGTFAIHSGCKVLVHKGAILELGSGYANADVRISCYKRISIGQDVIIANNVTIQDSDSHQISGTGTPTSPILIGDHVWICANAMILKGVKIGPGAVVAAGSIVTKDVAPETLVAGSPAKLIRTVRWQHMSPSD